MMISNDSPGFLNSRQDAPAARVAIVTDSIAQVPAETASRYGIHIVPFSVVVEGETIKDLSDYNLGKLYRRMRTEKNLRLSTSAPSIGEFYEMFVNTLNSGAKSIVYVGITSRLSHGFSTAVEAARMVHDAFGEQTVSLIDTRMATVAQGFLAIEAAKMAINGASPKEIIHHVGNERKRIGFAAGLETLEYLARGGRIGKAAYMLGSVIRILPVVTLDQKGEVMPISKSFGYNRVLEDCIRYVKEKVAGYRTLTLAVMHADALQWAEKLQKMAVEQFHPDEIFITGFTPAMVAHTGPGLIGLAYHWKP